MFPWLLLLAAWPAEAGNKLLFYDPDANQERILTITELFNDYLESAHATVVFEPVQTADAFEARAHEIDAKFAIVSSAYLQHGKHVALTPLLVPESGGSVYYHKVLVDLGQGPPLQLAGKTIAATVTDEEAAGVLAYLRTQSVNVGGAFVISVSKDVDALLAVTFGQADAALVTEASIEVLQQINPTTSARFRKLLQTGNILRAPLCELEKRPRVEEREAIVKLMSGLSTDARGQRLLQVLSTARWVPFKPGMLQ